jgi:TetR/AcrR family transcriptional regulator, mexCD-oprJ operon repressor
MPDAATDHRRATAEHNVQAILDAAEVLLARGDTASITAVASEAGVSRVTVYAHFPDPQALLEAVTKRSVSGFSEHLDAAALDEGSPLEALDRLVARAWTELDRHGVIAEAASRHLSPAALARAHKSLHQPIARLIKRGRASGDFRTDLPAGWLVSTYFALMHACGDDVRAGKLPVKEATRVLQTTLRAVFIGPAA